MLFHLKHTPPPPNTHIHITSALETTMRINVLSSVPNPLIAFFKRSAKYFGLHLIFCAEKNKTKHEPHTSSYKQQIVHLSPTIATKDVFYVFIFKHIVASTAGTAYIQRCIY